MSGAIASPAGRSHGEMTAHDTEYEKLCAVIDRAYSCSVALRAHFGSAVKTEQRDDLHAVK